MLSLGHAVFCALAMVALVPPDVFGQQRGPYIPKKKPVAPLPVVPEVDEPDVQGNNGQSGNIQVKQGTDEAMLHIEELENTISTMKQENIQMEQAINSLRLTAITQQKTMQVIATKVTELDKLANQNRELTRLLTYFETFFGVLYYEVPEAFDSTLPVETRLSLLNSYIGNREAELAGIRPTPAVRVEPDNSNISDQVAKAVVQLSQENAKLTTKVQTLEADVATTNAEVQSVKSKSGVGLLGPATCTCGEDMEDRLDRLETTTAVLAEYTSNIGSPSSPSSPSSPTSKKTGSTIPLLSVEDIDILRTSYIDSGATSRGVSDSRKSVFSAIRNTFMLGDDERQVLSFDSVHINKGGNFKNNSIFVCTTEGFYFFDFTVRSYDGHYMGVALLKNSEMMTSVYTDASERSIMQSQHIILHMTKGDEVWLELGSSERFAIHSDVHKYVTFNGFLIYKGR